MTLMFFQLYLKMIEAFVNYLKVVGGCIVQTQSMELSKKLNETDEELLRLFIVDIRNKYKSTSKSIFSSTVFNSNLGDLKIFTPKIGDKRKLVELSLNNALIMQKEKTKS